MRTMLIISHQGQSIELQPDSLIVIHNVSLQQYETFANEDLKLDYDGECLYIHSPATYQHEKIVFKVMTLLTTYFKEHPLKGDARGSHFSIHLPNGKRVEPDVVVIPPESVRPEETTYIGTPLMVVEVLSPSTRNHDLKTKKEWYMENETPEIWFVDPLKEKITVYYYSEETKNYHNKESKKKGVQSKILSGFELLIKQLFH
ncbi:MAG: hypothetical protein GF308_19580 [Candidatus Heimdallarchaeota archaeon]|nr:hypothetical protein [Candidatus Heimdallarchaeota archaeon]